MILSKQYTHVYATCLGEFKAGTQWAGEMAMIGFRIACWPSITDVKLIADLPIRGGLQPMLALHSDTNWNVVQRWDDSDQALQHYWSMSTQTDLATQLRTYLTSIKAHQSNTFNWTAIKLAPIAVDGSYAQGSTEFTFTEAGKITGAVTSLLPPEVAMASSYGADVPGRGGRSRVYLPALGQPCITSQGILDGTVRTAINQHMVTLHANVMANVGAVDVEYRIVSTSAKATRYVLPQQAWAGAHADCQRRRQHQTVETRQVQAIAQ